MTSKVAKHVDLQLTEDAVNLIVIEPANKGGLRVKTCIDKDELFTDYIMTGVTEERNEIHLEVPVSVLLEVLKHAASAHTFKIKLSKKATPVLVALAELPSAMSAQRCVSHDIPVRVIPVADWTKIEEREEMDAKIRSYQVNHFRSFIERIKTISNICSFRVTKDSDGDLELKVSAEIPQQVRIVTTFKDLQYPRECGPAEIDLDIRKVSSLLAGLHILPTCLEIHILNKDFANIVLDFDEMRTLLVLPAVHT